MYGSRFLCVVALVLMFSAAGAEEKLQPRRVEGAAGAIIGMTLRGNVLYTAGRGRLDWFDVSDPEKPVKLGSIPGVYGRQMLTAGDRLYITGRQQGLRIFDIKNPRRPTLIRRFDTVEMATGLAVSGDLAVTSERIYGCPIYSVADPAHPRLVNILRGGEIQSCVFRYPMLYGGSWKEGRIDVWDLSDPLKPKKCSTLQLSGYGDGVAISGDYLFAATGKHRRHVPKGIGQNDGWGLEIFDLKADPAKPKPAGKIHFPPKSYGWFDSWTVRVSQDIAYVGATANGVFIVDVKDKNAPRLLGHFELNPGEKITDCVGAIAVGNGVIYIGTLKQGLWVLPYAAAVPVEEAPSAKPKVAAIPPVRIPGFTVYPTEFQARRLALDGDTLYAALGDGGLGVYSVSEDGLKEIRTFSGKCVYDVGFGNGRLYTAEGIDGIGVYELKDDRLTEIGRMKRPCYVLHLLSDPRWLAYSSGSRFFFADIRNPKKIKRVFSHANVGLFYIDRLGDADFAGLYPVNGFIGGFYWIDLHGAKPKIRLHCKKMRTSQLSGICRFGKKLFVPCGNHFLLLEPGEDPTNAKPFAKGKRFRFGGSIGAADGDIVALSMRNHGTLLVYDLADPDKPVLMKKRSFENQLCSPDRPVFWNGRLIVPGGFAGILFEDRQVR